MSERPPSDPAAAGPAPAPKAPPPELSARAPRPKAVRLRGSVVKLVFVGGVVLVSGALAWAFVVQPELRATARDRAEGAGREEVRRSVRPTEAVTDQPATYDRLPPPRGGAASAPEEEAVRTPETPVSRPASAAGPRSGSGAPSAAALAARSGLFFAEVRGGAAHPSGPTPTTGIPVPALPSAPAGPTSDGTAGAASPAGYNRHRLTAPLSPYELKAGSMVAATLLTAIDTARAGPVVATVTQNVFDTVTGRHLLVPQGARLIGRAEGESRYGDDRAFIVWERLILPNGKSLMLDGEAGVDAQGAVGVRGRVDRRLVPLVVGTLIGGAVTALGQAARDGQDGGGLLGDAGDAAAIEGAQVGGRLVDRELAVRPSVRLSAGALVRVMITRDLVLEPYAS